MKTYFRVGLCVSLFASAMTFGPPAEAAPPSPTTPCTLTNLGENQSLLWVRRDGSGIYMNYQCTEEGWMFTGSTPCAFNSSGQCVPV